MYRALWEKPTDKTQPFALVYIQTDAQNVLLNIHFFLSCKTNAKVKIAKAGHSLHYSQINCVVLRNVCVYMCTVLLPPGGYPITVNIYIDIKIFHKNLISIPRVVT
jgi:hypothetical protein